MITPSFGRWLWPTLGAVLALTALRAADEPAAAAAPVPEVEADEVPDSKDD